MGTLFLWGEIEEWIVLITMSIPPVWPLFRPFTRRFINSNLTRSHRYNYNNYNNYHNNNYYKQPRSITAEHGPSPRVSPPLVTTTISISSTKGAVVPSESSSRVSHERTPHSFVEDRNAQQPWLEMREMGDQRKST